MTIGVDVGGTFTDVARWDGTRLTTAKLRNDPKSERGGGRGGSPGRSVRSRPIRFSFMEPRSPPTPFSSAGEPATALVTNVASRI